jgi:hypothetical protein
MNWNQQQQFNLITRFEPKCCVTTAIKKPVQITRYVPPGAIRSLQIAGASPGCCASTVISKDIQACLCRVRNGTIPAVNPAPPTPPPPTLRVIVAGGEDNLGAGSHGNTLFYSIDEGVTWSPTLGTRFLTYGYDAAQGGTTTWIAVGADGFVAGGNSILRSADGITWSPAGPTRFTSSGFGVAWGNNLWVAVGNNPALLYSTTDGLTWSSAGVTGFGTAGTCIAYGNGRWVAGAPGLVTSLDGLAWSTCAGTTFAPSGSAAGVAYDGTGRWVAVGSDQTSPTLPTVSIVTSTDGINWVSATSGGFTGSLGGSGVDYSPQQGRWVAGGNGTSSILVSSDGQNWSGVGVTGAPASVNSVLWTGTRWIATGGSPKTICWSLDGYTWVTASGTIPLLQGYGMGI